MDQCTHEVHAEYWRKIIQACSQLKTGWMRMESANKAIITGRDGSGKK